MFVQEVAIDIKTEANKDELVEEFNLLVSYFHSNGQTQGKIESQFIDQNRIVCFPFSHEKNSLSSEFHNFYVNRQIEKLENICGSKLQIRTVGKTFESYQGACKCEKPELYILITNYITIQSPITCGTCNQALPLYKLPKYSDHGYRPILSWESNYQSCDTLQMNCEVGERWALNQMQEFNSQLSKQGLEICKKVEELTGVPTYYYLFNYRKIKGDELTKPCPKCGKQWNLKEPLHGFYDFKCDTCKLVSTITSNS